jgi:hypothetical protein
MTVKCAPGAREKGRTSPVSLKSFAYRASLLKITVAVPVFVIVKVIAFWVPTVTLGKFALDGLKARVPWVAAAARSPSTAERIAALNKVSQRIPRNGRNVPWDRSHLFFSARQNAALSGRAFGFLWGGTFLQFTKLSDAARCYSRDAVRLCRVALFGERLPPPAALRIPRIVD